MTQKAPPGTAWWHSAGDILAEEPPYWHGDEGRPAETRETEWRCEACGETFEAAEEQSLCFPCEAGEWSCDSCGDYFKAPQGQRLCEACGESP